MEHYNQLLELIYNNKNTQEPLYQIHNEWLITGEHSIFKSSGSLAYLINLPTALLNLVVFGSVSSNGVDPDLEKDELILSVELGGEDVSEEVIQTKSLIIKIDEIDAKNILIGKNLYDVIVRKIAENRTPFFIKETVKMYSLNTFELTNTKDTLIKVKKMNVDLVPNFLKQIVVNFN